MELAGGGGPVALGAPSVPVGLAGWQSGRQAGKQATGRPAARRMQSAKPLAAPVGAPTSVAIIAIAITAVGRHHYVRGPQRQRQRRRRRRQCQRKSGGPGWPRELEPSCWLGTAAIRPPEQPAGRPAERPTGGHAPATGGSGRRPRAHTHTHTWAPLFNVSAVASARRRAEAGRSSLRRSGLQPLFVFGDGRRARRSDPFGQLFAFERPL